MKDFFFESVGLPGRSPELGKGNSVGSLHRSKVVLEELDSVRDPQETRNFPPLFPIDVQRGEYVQHAPESE